MSKIFVFLLVLSRISTPLLAADSSDVDKEKSLQATRSIQAEEAYIKVHGEGFGQYVAYCTEHKENVNTTDMRRFLGRVLTDWGTFKRQCEFVYKIPTEEMIKRIYETMLSEKDPQRKAAGPSVTLAPPLTATASPRSSTLLAPISPAEKIGLLDEEDMPSNNDSTSLLGIRHRKLTVQSD